MTPIGDPPLFLGFLKGVDFTWTLIHMYKPMLLVSIILIVLFFIIDSYFYKKEIDAAPTSEKFSIKIDGKINFLLIGFIIMAVIISGNDILKNIDLYDYRFLPYKDLMSLGTLIQLIILLIVTWVSLRITPKEYRNANGFTWEPIKEVAKLFATIFLTMIPAIEMLKGVTKGIGPMSWMKNIIIDKEQNIDYMYFWLTGLLSGFLDNAPTYVVFFTTALGEHDVSWLMKFEDGGGLTLLAISCGSVFMGAMTYIGNAPNFMVKSIAEENQISMPSFFWIYDLVDFNLDSNFYIN